MPAKREDCSYGTVAEALQRETVDVLKDLAQLVGDRKPTRKSAFLTA